MLAAYLNPRDKNNLREVSKKAREFIDLTIENMVVRELNKASLTRITNAANWLRSLRIDLIATHHTLTFPYLLALKKLDLSLTNISADQLQPIIQRSPLLEELNVLDCCKAPTGIIRTLKNNKLALQHLKKLNLSNTDISNDHLQTIIQHCPDLEELNVCSCNDAPAGIIQALTVNPHALQHLKKLNLSCTHSSVNDIRTIIQHQSRTCPHIQII